MLHTIVRYRVFTPETKNTAREHAVTHEHRPKSAESTTETKFTNSDSTTAFGCGHAPRHIAATERHTQIFNLSFGCEFFLQETT